MQRLLDALDANFVGYEDVKKMCDEARSTAMMTTK